MLAHFVPVDFNHDSICGLPKHEWKNGTNNWDWVTCPACLEHRPINDETVTRNMAEVTEQEN